jgi:hypothetical protein
LALTFHARPQASHNILVANNTFAECGCVQNRGDRGGIAVMCPGGHQPSGHISDNVFFLCPGNITPAIFVNPALPHCADDLIMSGNTIDGSAPLVTMPQVSFNPPAPTDNATTGNLPVLGVTTTPGATIRYTLDGSRPSESSPIVDPEAGIILNWPGPAIVVNMRAWKDGYTPSVTNGAVVELNYVLGREAPAASRLLPEGHLNGKLDSHTLSATNVTVHGWAVDTLAAKGAAPVTIVASVDGAAVMSFLANQPRPDLVAWGVAPDPLHGFTASLPAAAAAMLMGAGKHSVSVVAVGTPSTQQPTALPGGSEVLMCDGTVCGPDK